MKRILKYSFSFMFILLMGLIATNSLGSFFANININAKSIEQVYNTSNIKNALLSDTDFAELEISSESSMGIVRGGGSYAVGDTVTLIAEANDGRYFKKWQIYNEEQLDYVDFSEFNPVQFTIEKDTKVKAVFDFTEYSVVTNFDEYFQLTNFENPEYSFDSQVFETEELNNNYTRSLITENSKTYGKFYYKDVVTIEYVQKENVTTGEKTYIAELRASNFSSFKEIVTVNLNESGEVFSIEKEGTVTNYATPLSLDELEYNYDNYDYVLLTQKSVGENVYTTTKISIKTQVLDDNEFTMNAEKLKKITLTSKEFISESETSELDINLVKELFNFEYGYYGILDESASIYEYLVVENSFYRITFNSNDFFTYKRVMIDQYYTSNEIIGSFSSSLSSIAIEYERNCYSFNFHEYLLKDGELTEIEDVIILEDILAYPSSTLKIDPSDMTLNLTDSEENQLQNSTLSFAKLGYSIKAITTNLNELTFKSLELTLDADNPENVDVYFVYEYINYNATIKLFDVNGNEITFIEHYLGEITSDFDVVVGQSVELKATAKDGYIVCGWQLLKESEYITTNNQTTFEFAPTSNTQTELTYVCVLDYKYTALNYTLDSSSIIEDTSFEPASYTYMGEQSVAKVTQFKFNSNTYLLQIYANVYFEDIVNDLTDTLIYEENLTNPTTSVNDNITTTIYSCQLGNVTIISINGKLFSLKISDKEFLYNETNSNFLPILLETKTNVSITRTKEAKTNNFLISDVTVDDLLILRTLNTDENSYVFSNIVKIEDENRIDITRKSVEFLDGTTYRVHLFNQTKDSTLSVVYASKTGEIYVYSNNDKAYLNNNISFEFSTEKGNSDYKENWIVISEESNKSVKIVISTSYITAGYKFTGFKFANSDDMLDYATTRNGEDKIIEYTHSFVVSSDYMDNFVVACFEEIEYIVRVVETNGTLSFEKNGVTNKISNDGTGEFRISVADLSNTATLSVVSSEGYYISHAYFNQEANIINNLIGNAFEETKSKLIFALDDDGSYDTFKNYIIDVASDDYIVYLFLIETERTYSLRVIYNIVNLDTISAIKDDVEVTLTYTDFNGETLKVGDVNYVTFSEVPYFSEINLLARYSNAQGVDFQYWQNGKDIVTTDSYSLILNDYLDASKSVLNITLNFKALEYVVNFINVDKNGQVISGEDEVGFVRVDGRIISSTNLLTVKIGENITGTVVENAGYKYENYLYYLRNGSKSTQGIVQDKETDIHIFSLSFLTPSLFLTTTISEQKENAEARVLNIYVTYIEKTYILSYEILDNDESHEDFLTYFDQDNYQIITDINNIEIETTLDGKINRYKIGSEVQIQFRLSKNILNLVKINLGSNVYSVTADIINSGLININGQGIVLSKEERDVNGENLTFYCLKFTLSSKLLEQIGTEENLKISYYYEIKTYYYSVSSNMVGQGFNVSHSCTEYDEIKGSSTTTTTNTPAEPRGKKAVEYGKQLKWAYSTNKAIDNFNDKYTLNSVYLYIYEGSGNSKVLIDTKKLLEFDSQNVAETSIEKWLEETFVLGTSLNVWDVIEQYENCKSFQVYANFTPKITINLKFDNFEQYYYKETVYNARTQGLTKSGDVANPEVVYDTSLEEGIEDSDKLVIKYRAINGGGWSTREPKDASTYEVQITFLGSTFNGEIRIIIKPAEISLTYTGENISKTYDGTKSLTTANLTTLKKYIKINGLYPEDSLTFDLKTLIANFSDDNVGTNLDIITSEIILPMSVVNYYFTGGATTTSLTVAGKGEITPKALEISQVGLTLKNMLYYEDYEPNLKEYNNLSQDSFAFSLDSSKAPVGSDYVYIDIEKLEVKLSSYSIGRNKIVTFVFSSALEGPDKANYIVADSYTYIDIYPSKLEYEFDNGLKFVIEDRESLFIIPIEMYTGDFSVKIINSLSPEYPEKYKQVESIIHKSERILAFYRFELKTASGNSIDLNTLAGAYVTIQPLAKVVKVYQVDNSSVGEFGYAYENKTITFKIDAKSNNEILVLESRTYFSIWKVIRIVLIILLILLILVILFIIFKRIMKKRRDRHSEY